MFRSVAFVVAFLFVASELSHAGHRCSSQVLGSANPPLPPVCLFYVFLPLFTGSDPIGATLSQP